MSSSASTVCGGAKCNTTGWLTAPCRDAQLHTSGLRRLAQPFGADYHGRALAVPSWQAIPEDFSHMPQLIASVEGVEIKHVYLQKNRTTLGRHVDNDIVFDNMVVSGHHCVFELQGLADVFIEDLR